MDGQNPPAQTAREPLENEGPGRIILELDFESEFVGDGIRCLTRVTPEVHVPATGRLRASVVASLIDVTLGNVAVKEIYPRPAMTTSLDLHLWEPLPSDGEVEILGRPLRIGRTLIALEAEVRHDGRPVGMATATFVPPPDPSLVVEQAAPMGTPELELSMALVDRAGIEVVAPGHAVLPDQQGVRNGGGVYFGGLLALVAEEAATSLTPGEDLSTLTVRYLQAVHLGPAVARAQVHDGVGRVEVRDAGRDNRLAALAVTRTFGAR